MKRLLGLAMILVATGPTVALADTIVLQADVWCPYNCEPGAERPGYMVEIAQEVFGAAGHTVDYQVAPWTRALANVRSGMAQGAIGASETDAEGFVFPAQPLGVSANGFAVRKAQGWTYQGLESLSGHQVGVIQDYSYGEELDTWIAANAGQVQALSGDDALDMNLRKLIAGRVDAVLDDVNVLSYAVRTGGLGDEVVVQKTAKAQPVSIAFTPGAATSDTYAALLADGIVTLRESGRLAEILSAYGLSDWQ